MYKREIMAQLRGWAGSKQRKPLVLRGARQVGKTTLVEEFGKEFDSFISLNLEKDDAEVSAGSRPLPKCGSTCVSSITSPCARSRSWGISKPRGMMTGRSRYGASMRTRFFIQDLHTPAPENKQFKLINLPFYYVCQLDRVLDEAPVTIGDGCFIDSNVSIYTACHSTDPVKRNSRREWAKPGSIGDNVWIGGSVTILPTSLPQGFPHLYSRSAARLPEPQ